MWWLHRQRRGGLTGVCVLAMSDVFDVAPANRLDFDPLSPGWGACCSIICWCGIGTEDDNEKKREVLRTL